MVEVTAFFAWRVPTGSQQKRPQIECPDGNDRPSRARRGTVGRGRLSCSAFSRGIRKCNARRIRSNGIGAVRIVCQPNSASADTDGAMLSGYQEIPPISTNGTGTSFAEIDTEREAIAGKPWYSGFERGVRFPKHRMGP